MLMEEVSSFDGDCGGCGDDLVIESSSIDSDQSSK